MSETDICKILKDLEGYEFDDCSVKKYMELQTDQARLDFIEDLRLELSSQISENNEDISALESENEELERSQIDLEISRHQLKVKLGLAPVPGQLPLPSSKESDYEAI